MKCRPRPAIIEPDTDAYPFTGDDGDRAAIRLLNKIGKDLLLNQPPHRSNQPMGEFMTAKDIETLTLINHITCYLDNRAEYAKIADELRGYLVIE